MSCPGFCVACLSYLDLHVICSSVFRCAMSVNRSVILCCSFFSLPVTSYLHLIVLHSFMSEQKLAVSKSNIVSRPVFYIFCFTRLILNMLKHSCWTLHAIMQFGLTCFGYSKERCLLHRNLLSAFSFGDVHVQSQQTHLQNAILPSIRHLHYHTTFYIYRIIIKAAKLPLAT